MKGLATHGAYGCEERSLAVKYKPLGSGRKAASPLSAREENEGRDAETTGSKHPSIRATRGNC